MKRVELFILSGGLFLWTLGSYALKSNSFMLNLILKSISKVIDIVNLSGNEVDRNASENIRTNIHRHTHTQSK